LALALFFWFITKLGANADKDNDTLHIFKEFWDFEVKSAFISDAWPFLILFF